MTEAQGPDAQAAEGQAPEANDKPDVQVQVTDDKSGEDSATAQIAALRQEAAKYRTERNRLAAEKEERENAEKSEIEKAQGEVQKRDKRIAELETLAKQGSFERQFGRDGDVAFQIANANGIPIEYDDLKATNVEAVRKELRKLKPHIFGDGPADAGNKTPANNGYQGPPGMNRLAHAYSQRS